MGTCGEGIAPITAMSAYLNTRVSLYASRLWPDDALDTLLSAPDEAVAVTLAEHGLAQTGAAGYDSLRPDSMIRARWNSASLPSFLTRRGC